MFFTLTMTLAPAGTLINVEAETFPYVLAVATV